MAIDDWDINLPVRHGPAIGKSMENRALNNLGQRRVESCATKIINNPDGSTTRLKTKGGNPEFITEKESDKDETGTPLFIYGYPDYKFIGDAFNRQTDGLLVKHARSSKGAYAGYGPAKTLPTIPLTAPAGDSFSPIKSPVLLGADGKGKWAGVSPVKTGAYPDDLITYSVIRGGASSTYRTLYSISKPRATYISSEYLGDTTRAALDSDPAGSDNYRFIGNCHINGAVVDYVLEEEWKGDAIPDISALSLSSSYDSGADVSAWVTPYNPIVGSPDFFVVNLRFALKKLTSVGGGTYSSASIPDIPFLANKSYAYAGSGFFSPNEPVLVFGEYNYVTKFYIATFTFVDGVSVNAVHGSDPGLSSAWGKSVASLTEWDGARAFRLVMFVLRAGVWQTIDISSAMPNVRSGTTPSLYYGMTVCPITSTKVLVAPRDSYAVTAPNYANSCAIVDTVSETTTSVSYVTNSTSEPRMMDIHLVAEQTWVETITSWPRLGNVNFPANTPPPTLLSFRVTSDNGASFTSISTGRPYGFEKIVPIKKKLAGDFSGVICLAADSFWRDSVLQNVYQARIYTTDDFVIYAAAADYVDIELVRYGPVCLFYAGSPEKPADIDVVYPWRRHSGKPTPAFW